MWARPRTPAPRPRPGAAGPRETAMPAPAASTKGKQHPAITNLNQKAICIIRLFNTMPVPSNAYEWSHPILPASRARPRRCPMKAASRPAAQPNGWSHISTGRQLQKGLQTRYAFSSLEPLSCFHSGGLLGSSTPSSSAPAARLVLARGCELHEQEITGQIQGRKHITLSCVNAESLVVPVVWNHSGARKVPPSPK